ncbi:hypothetical protein GJAV_G00069870 [Gymnothorax javanicus]|nr:hypothetical protein GJAV_G00069870 [Gymnothorax javanicus]
MLMPGECHRTTGDHKGERKKGLRNNCFDNYNLRRLKSYRHDGEPGWQRSATPSGSGVSFMEEAQLGEIGTSCYTKSGMILCRNDYIRLFGNSGACSACGQSIPASELVMRAQGNVYHLKCFTCSTCRNRLVPGDRFHYINGSLFCEHDRPTALINGHLNSLQTNPLLPDQKVC